MKDNKELTREDIAIESDIEVSDSNPNELVAYVETWFDVDEKFGLNTRDDADTWVNMYARYDVEEDTLKLECIISRDKEEKPFCYEPTENEAVMLKEAIKDKLKEYYDCTPKEFCQNETGMIMSQS